MSRARAIADRLPGDTYQTPLRLAHAICSRLRSTFRDWVPEEVLEPSAGLGAFVRAARAAWPDAQVLANEIDRGFHRTLLQSGAHVVHHEDWLKLGRTLAEASTGAGPRHLILGNPPFRFARQHIEAALSAMLPDDRLCFLLRLNFLGSSDRVEFWKQPGLQSVATIAPRPSFTGKGSDGTEYAVFTWVKGFTGVPIIQTPLTWEPERKVRKKPAKAARPAKRRRAA
jgi:hypothetical protein